MCERAVVFPGILFCCALSRVSAIQSLDAVKLFCSICLFFQVALGDNIDFFYFTRMLFYILPFVVHAGVCTSTKSCCLATEYDFQIESAVSLSCLLQDDSDVCNSPII